MGNGIRLENQRQQPYKIYLRHNLSPGDTLVCGSAIASLHKAYPGQYLVGFQGTWGREIFQGNPGIVDLPPAQCHIAEMHYNAINDVSRRDVSFLQAFHEHLSSIIRRPLPVLVTKPQLFLTEEEKETRVPGTENLGPYIVGNFGAKGDYPTKTPGRHIWQSVVNALKGRINFIQVGEKNTSHAHPPIEGAVNLIGQTNARQLFQLVHHSIGCLTGVSLLMHVASALDRVAFVAGGGREGQFPTYESTQYFHCMGMLPCAKVGGCWKSFVTKEQGTGKMCELPVIQPDGEIIPRCHQLACGQSGERIIAAIEMMLDARGV